MVKCSYCSHDFSTKTSLNSHQKTAKYCLKIQEAEGVEIKFLFKCNFCSKILSQQIDLDRHQLKCSSKKETDNNNKYELIIIELQTSIASHKKEIEQNNIELERKLSIKDRIIKKIRLECEKKLSDKDRIIEEQKIIIKEFQDDQRKQNKDLTDRIQSMAEKAIAKPSTLNQNIINNMMPITDAHLQEHVQNLNPVHVQNGASGYAKYALEYPLKDMIVCTDFQRRNCKYKDENGNVVSDPEMTKITKRLFSAIKERNEELINEYSAELQAKWKSMNASGNPDMDQEESEHFASKTNEALEIAMDILSQKRQTSEMANGMRPDLFYGFVRELAAGCYRSEKC
jgi:hypothetical protein